MGSGGRRALSPVEEHRALILLRLLPGVGDRRLTRILRATGSARRTLDLSSAKFAKALGPKAERARRDSKMRHRVTQILERCQALDIEILSLGSPIYPPESPGPCRPTPPSLPPGRHGVSEPEKRRDRRIPAGHGCRKANGREDRQGAVRARGHGRERSGSGNRRRGPSWSAVWRRGNDRGARMRSGSPLSGGQSASLSRDPRTSSTRK